MVSLEDRDAEELVLVLQGYYRLLTENPLAVTHIRDRNSVDQGRCRSRVWAKDLKNSPYLVRLMKMLNKNRTDCCRAAFRWKVS